MTRNSPNFSIYFKKKTKRRFPFHSSWLISFQSEIQFQWLKKMDWKIWKGKRKFQSSLSNVVWRCRRALKKMDLLGKKGPAMFSWFFSWNGETDLKSKKNLFYSCISYLLIFISVSGIAIFSVKLTWIVLLARQAITSTNFGCSRRYKLTNDKYHYSFYFGDRDIQDLLNWYIFYEIDLLDFGKNWLFFGFGKESKG